MFLIPGVLSVKEIDLAKEFWIKYVQMSETEELKKSVSNGSEKVHRKYRRLPVFKDEKGIWRVLLRLNTLPLLMTSAHQPFFLLRIG